MKNVLITGVSSGIGLAATRLFIQKGYRVFGSVRREEDGERLKAELGSSFAALYFDVTNADSVRRAGERLASLIPNDGLVALINNAGIAVTGPLMHVPMDEFEHQFNVNVFGVMRVTQAFLPLLGADQDCLFPAGKIINISSAVGKTNFPFLGPYVGSKHAIEGLSGTLRKELQLYGIDVVVVGPGAVNTPIWDKDSAQDLSAFEDTHYYESGSKFQKAFVKMGKTGNSPEKIAKLLHKIVEKKKTKTRYRITPHPMSEWFLPKFLPTRRFDKMLAKRLGLTSKDLDAIPRKIEDIY